MTASWMRGVAFQPSRDWFRYFSIAGVVLGVLVRLVQYLSQRSLWSDEAMLALNIVDRSYAALLQPLGYNQAAPPFFCGLKKPLCSFWATTNMRCGYFHSFVGWLLSLRFIYLPAVTSRLWLHPLQLGCLPA
jgi:hypothetical protein